MLSIKKINAGSGYEYLTRSVVHGDADYYLRGTTAGDPPGVWAGRGAAQLGVEGEAAEIQIRNLFGLGVHPNHPDQPLGSEFAPPSYALDRIRRWEASHPDAPPEERAAIVATERAKGNRNAIAGLDLTFSPPKSWSVLWAAARPHEREQMWAAHHTGITAALQFMETHAAFTRTGHDGVRQLETTGLTAVRFDHTTSRTGDVQPHSHLLVSTKVQGHDGRWRALDTAQVYATLAAAGAIYSTVRDTETARALGTVHQLRADLKEREVLGVPEQLRREYSGRRAQIEQQLAALLTAWQDRHGTPAPAAVRARMSEFLTLRTRPGKRHGETVDQMLSRMEDRARGAGFAFDTVREAALGQRTQPRDPAAASPVDLVAAGLQAVTTERSIWTRWHLLRAIENRQSIDTQLTPQQIIHRAEALTDAALAHPDVRRISAPELLNIPIELRRRIDDQSVFARYGSTVYTTQDLLNAERQLLDATRRQTGHTVPRSLVDQVLAEHAATGTPLDAGQAAAVRRFVTQDRGLDVLEGPAGSGKSRAMRAVVDAWTASGRDVLGLALSQTAAQVLADEAGCRAENIARFLWHASKSDAPNPDERWRLSPGQLVLIDEAAMADTRSVARVEALVRRAGGVLRAVGDDAQLASPEAGGWFSLIAEDVAALRLTQLHRFTNDWEADASLQLRAGDQDIIAVYAAHGRIVGGDVANLETAAYDAWRDDERMGLTSLLLVGTNARASHLSARARADLVDMGKVEPDGVPLHDGNLAGVGDRIVTRLNDARVRDHNDQQVANRDHWIVRARGRDGRLTVERLSNSTGRPTGQQVQLTADYVLADVELAYAAVMASRQGATVDTSHTLPDELTDLRALYMAMTRGRARNTVYPETTRTGGEDQALGNTAEAVLAGIMRDAHRTRPISAHQAIREAQLGVTSLATLGPIWEDTVAAAARQQVTTILRAAGGEHIAQAAQDDPAWPTLLAMARAAGDAGWDLDTLLTAAVIERDFHDAEGVAKVLTWRVQRIIDESPAPTPAPDAEDNPAGPLAASRSYRDRTPAGDDPDLVVAAQAAEFLDARVEALGQQLTEDPPEWTTRVLGPVPEDPTERADWTRRASAIGAYRERYGLRGAATGEPGADQAIQLLGPRPQASRAEAVAAWEYAHVALGEASELTRLRAAGDDELRAAVAAAASTQADRPPYSGVELRAAALALRAAQAADAQLRTRAEQAAGQRGRLARWHSGSAATRAALDTQLAGLTTALQERAAVTTSARTRYETAAAADERWRDWDTRTGPARRTGRLAAAVLAARSDTAARPRDGGPPSRLAQLADVERQAAARTAQRVRDATSGQAERERVWREDQARVLRDDPDRRGPDRGPGR
jgi:conjugative relaxase-like TrwC/TraI family protein